MADGDGKDGVTGDGTGDGTLDGNGGDNGGLRLRVDRLAAAMEAARARARAEAAGAPPPDRSSARRATSVRDAEGHGSGGQFPGDLSDDEKSGPEAGTPRMADTPVPVELHAASDTATVPEIGAGRHDDPGADPRQASVAADDPPRGAPDADKTDAPEAAPDETGPDQTGPDQTAPDDAAVPPYPSPGPAPRVPPLLLTPDLQPHGPEAAPQDGAAAARGSAMASVDAPSMDAAPVPPAPVADPAMAAALLSVRGVATDIGRYRILQDVTVDVPRGGVTILLGRNGAGKTTTLRTIMGLWRARAGEIVFAGDRIDRWPTHRIARAGVGYVPESMSIFGDLTVAENIALGARSGPVARDRLDWLTGLFPPLGTFWRSPAGNLSGGQKQMLALARALVEKRRLYLIDEPTKGLAPVIVETVVAALRDLKLQGATILMVEQNFAVARALGDACAVIDDGRVVWSGTVAALADDPALQARFMGLDLGDAA